MSTNKQPQEESKQGHLSRTLSQMFAKHNEEGGDEKRLKRWDSLRVVQKSVSRMTDTIKTKTKGSTIIGRGSTKAKSRSTIGRKSKATPRLDGSAQHIPTVFVPPQQPLANEATRFFKVPLELLMERQATDAPQLCVPVTVNKLLEHLSIRGQREVGILRVSASASDTATVRGAIDSGLAPDLYACNVNVIGDLLKSFVRELPDGFLADAYWDDWMAAARIPNELARARACQAMVEKLDKHRQALATVLFGFLRDLARHEKYTKMDIFNLARVFAPNILHSDNVIEQMAANPELITLSETMTKQYGIVFGELPKKFKMIRTINPKNAVAARGTQGKNKVFATLREAPARPNQVEAESIQAPATEKPTFKKMKSEEVLRQRFRLAIPAPTLSRARTVQEFKGTTEATAAIKGRKRVSNSLFENENGPPNSPAKVARTAE